MLEFNQEHKAADLSLIKSKIDRAKNVGKVVLCGVVISSTLLLSGCIPATRNSVTNEPANVGQPVITSTAIIMENGNAVILDVSKYEKFSVSEGSDFYNDLANDRTWVLTTNEGDIILAGIETTKIIDGANSHQKAEMLAQGLVGETGQIICYDEVETYGKTR